MRPSTTWLPGVHSGHAGPRACRRARPLGSSAPRRSRSCRLLNTNHRRRSRADHRRGGVEGGPPRHGACLDRRRPPGEPPAGARGRVSGRWRALPQPDLPAGRGPRLQLDDAARDDQPDGAERVQPSYRPRGAPASGKLCSTSVSPSRCSPLTRAIWCSCSRPTRTSAPEKPATRRPTTPRAGASGGPSVGSSPPPCSRRG